MKHKILIPVYNDWKSLNKLLTEIDKCLKDENNFQTEILVINDNSSEVCFINNQDLTTIKKIEVLTIKKNLGSQKCIAIGLNYIKETGEDFLITVMDADGEDSPKELNKMLRTAYENRDFVITSNRKKRKEAFHIRFCYKVHLVISFLFAFKWISFGNFSTFDSRNLKKIFSNNSSWYAHSSSVLKNCKIKRVYAKREKRYFDKSKLNFIALFEHSLRVSSVFLIRIFIVSIAYSIFIFILFPLKPAFFFIFLIIVYNILLLFIRSKHYIKDLNRLSELILKKELF